MARKNSGVAAYQYFFVEASPMSKAAYEEAMAAEDDADAFLEALRGQQQVTTPGLKARAG